MTRGRKIILAIVITVLGTGVWIAGNFLYTLRHVSEAYAAWDTGTLLVEYMKAHENRWPASWDDLLTVLNSEAGRQIPLRGAQAGDLEYARSLREKVAVDWTFDPAASEARNVISRPGGGSFPVVWGGAEPNEMVRDYVKEHSTTRPGPSSGSE